MANKFLNILIDSVVTPVNIDDVVAVVATGNNGNVATTVAITYKSGKVATLTTPADDNGFNVATAPNVQRAFWSAITAAQELPWNMVSYPAPGKELILMVEPATSQSSEYAKQDAPPADTVFAGKQSSAVLAKDSGAIVWSTIAIS
tara:strand:+ start:690 stop:1127 length:438 start_codon:yes stop_codon:yes gene_type:complete